MNKHAQKIQNKHIYNNIHTYIQNRAEEHKYEYMSTLIMKIVALNLGFIDLRRCDGVDSTGECCYSRPAPVPPTGVC